MKIVIDIPDWIAIGIKKGIIENGSLASKTVLKAVRNGKPCEDEEATDDEP